MTECCDLLLDRLRRSLRPNLFVLSVLLSLARALSAHCICTHARADMHHTHPGGSGLAAAGDTARRAVQDSERKPRAVSGGGAGRLCAASAARGCALARRWQATLSLSSLCVGSHADARAQRERGEGGGGGVGEMCCLCRDVQCCAHIATSCKHDPKHRKSTRSGLWDARYCL